MKPKFNTGHEVMTRGVADWVDQAENPQQRYELILECLKRHILGDWGDVCAEDKQSNDHALKHGYRLLSAYTVDGTKIWIITEADRSSTTILFPDEY